MGLFGDSEGEREEVHLGEPEEKDEEDEKGTPADVGAVDFSSSESGESSSESDLRSEISSMDSVSDSRDTGTGRSSTADSGSSGHRVTSSTGSSDPDLKEIRDQNQEIIDKLEKVLNRL